MGVVAAGGHRPQPVPADQTRRDASPRTTLHCASLALTLVDAPMPVLGLHSRGCDHVSAGLWMDSLPYASRRPTDLRHLSVRIPHGIVQAAHSYGVAAISRVGYISGAGAGRHRAFALAAHDRSGRAHAAAVRD